jgi:hypothetical protein
VCLVFFSAQFLVTILNLVSRHFSFSFSELLLICVFLFEVLEDLFAAGFFFLVDLPVESKVSCGEFRELVPGKEVVTGVLDNCASGGASAPELSRQ